MEAAATQQAKQEEVPTSNPPTEVRAAPLQPQGASTEVLTSEASSPPNEVMAMAEQPQEETTEVETSEAPLTGANDAKTTQEVVQAEPTTAAKEEAGPSGSHSSAPITPPKASEPRKALYKGYTDEEWEEWRQAQNQPVRRTYKQKWKTNEELEAQRRRPGKREREALRQ